MKTNFLSTTKTIFSSLFISVLLLSCTKQPLMGCSLTVGGVVVADNNCNGIPDAMENGGTNPGGVITYSLTSARLVTPVNQLSRLDFNSKAVPVDMNPIDGFVDMKPYTMDMVEDYVTVLFNIGLASPVQVVVNRADLSRLALAPTNTTWAIEQSNLPFGHRRKEQTIDQSGNTTYVLPNDGQGYYYRLN